MIHVLCLTGSSQFGPFAVDLERLFEQLVIREGVVPWECGGSSG